MNVSLEELRTLSESMGSIPDDRPQWLKDMPYACEPTAQYYRFLWELVRRHKPEYTIEIGIDKGASTLTMAAANPAGTVLSVDINDAARESALKVASDHGIKNLVAVHDDSSRNVRLLKLIGRQADLLFIDGLHTFNQCYGEYEQYRPFVKPGGIILFDDVHVHREMEVAWEYIADPKVELPKAHYTGFGVCKVNGSLAAVPTWESIIQDASRKF